MSFAKFEVEQVLQQARALRNSKEEESLRQSLACYSSVIANVAPHPQYRSERAEVSYRLYDRLALPHCLDDAMEDTCEAIRLDPSNPKHHYALGLLKWAKVLLQPAVGAAVLQDAASCFTESLRLAPTDSDAWLSLIAIRIAAGDLDEAISLYGQCAPYMAKGSSQLLRSFYGCVALAIAGDVIEEEDTKPLRTQSIRFHSRHMREDCFLSFVAGAAPGVFRHRNASEAIRFIESFIGHYVDRDDRAALYIKLYSNGITLPKGGGIPKDSLPDSFMCYAQARAYAKCEVFGKAEEYFRRLAQLMPDLPDAWMGQSDALLKLDRGKESLDCAIAAIKCDEHQPGGWICRGKALQRLFRFREAEDSFRKAAELDPASYIPWLALGKLYNDFSIGVAGRNEVFDKSRAQECYLNASRLGGDDLDCWEEIGDLLFDSSLNEEAVAAYDAAMRHSFGEDSELWYKKGIAHNRLSQLQEALFCYEKALEISENYVQVWISKASLLEGLGQYEDVLKAYDRAIKLAPGKDYLLRNKADILCKLDQLEMAIEYIDQSLEKNPADKESWYRKGNLLVQLGRYQEAIGAYDNAIANDDGFQNMAHKAWHGKALAYEGLGQAVEAKKCYQMEKNAERDRLIGMGEFSEMLCNDPSALANYDDALALDPSFVSGWIKKGLLLFRMEEPAKAVECFDRALKLNRLSMEAWAGKGAALQNLGLTAQAISACNKAIRLAPRSPSAWYAKGTVLQAQSRHSDALRCYLRMLKIELNSTQALNAIGTIAIMQKRFDAAIRAVNTVLWLEPDDFEAWKNKGFLHMEQEQNNLFHPATAVKCFRKALETDSSDLECHFHIGRLLIWNLHQYKEAEQEFNELRELGASDSNGSISYHLGVSQFYQEKYDQAVENLSHAMSQNENGVDAWAYLAQALTAIGRPAEALPLFDKALARNPDDSAVLWNKGKACKALQQQELALACLERATRLNHDNLEAFYEKGLILTEMKKYVQAGWAFFRITEEKNAPLDLAILAYRGRQTALECMNDIENAQRCALMAQALEFMLAGDSRAGDGQNQEAIDLYEKALDLQSRMCMIWWKKGNAMLRLAQYEEALTCFKKAITLDGGCFEALAGKSVALLGLKQFQAALLVTNQALEIRQAGELWLQKVDILYRLGDYESALPRCDDLLAYMPCDDGALLRKGLILFKLGHPVDAISYFDKALYHKPSLTACKYYKGLCLMELHRPLEALGCFDEVIEKHTSDADAWNGRGDAQLELANPEEALKAYQKALELDPSRGSLLAAMGRINNKIGEPEQAILCFQAACRFNQQDHASWWELGSLQYSKGSFAEAADAFEVAASLDPGKSRYWYFNGKSLNLIGKFEEAAVCYRRATELDTNSFEAWLGLGEVLSRLNIIEDALVCYDRAIRICPKDSIGWRYKGLALHACHRYRDALRCFTQALRMNRTDALAWLEKGKVLKSLGRDRESVSAYEKARRLNPGLTVVE